MVVVGPPACGKGAVCQALVDQLGLVQLSTVKAYREALQSSGPEYADAKRAKDHLDTNLLDLCYSLFLPRFYSCHAGENPLLLPYMDVYNPRFYSCHAGENRTARIHSRLDPLECPSSVCLRGVAAMADTLPGSHPQVHSTKSATPHFPWLWGEPAASIMRDALNLRYRLIPYHYSLAHRLSETGMLYVRPLVAEFPADPNVVDMTSQVAGRGTHTY